MQIVNDIKSDRINDEVAILMGCTIKEIIILCSIILCLSIFISFPLFLVFSYSFTIHLAFSIVFSAIMFLPITLTFSKLKRGKPTGYYQQYLKIQCSKIGLMRNPYIMSSRKWSTVRMVEKQK